MFMIGLSGSNDACMDEHNACVGGYDACVGRSFEPEKMV